MFNSKSNNYLYIYIYICHYVDTSNLVSHNFSLHKHISWSCLYSEKKGGKKKEIQEVDRIGANGTEVNRIGPNGRHWTEWK